METADLCENGERRTEQTTHLASLESTLRAACVTVSRWPVSMNGSSISVTFPSGFTSEERQSLVDRGRRLADLYHLEYDVEGSMESEGAVHSIRFRQGAATISE